MWREYINRSLHMVTLVQMLTSLLWFSSLKDGYEMECSEKRVQL
jgi:hypothetical protein